MDVVKCPTWTQGPVLLQSLNLLQSFDLEAMGHNTGQYIHTVVEAMKLAYADREFYYGDPDFSDIPLERLLDPAHAAERAGLITDSASLELRPDGYAPLSEFGSVNDVNETVAAGPQHGDTTKLDIIDGDGNAISITTSGKRSKRQRSGRGIGRTVSIRVTANPENCCWKAASRRQPSKHLRHGGIIQSEPERMPAATLALVAARKRRGACCCRRARRHDSNPPMPWRIRTE